MRPFELSSLVETSEIDADAWIVNATLFIFILECQIPVSWSCNCDGDSSYLSSKTPGDSDNMRRKLLLVGTAAIVAVIALTMLFHSSLSQPPRAPYAEFSSVTTVSPYSIRATFGEADSGIDIMECKIIIHLNDTYVGTYPFDPNGTGDVNELLDGANYSISFVEFDENGMVDLGDAVYVEYSKGVLPSSEYRVYFLWRGQVV